MVNEIELETYYCKINWNEKSKTNLFYMPLRGSEFLIRYHSRYNSSKKSSEYNIHVQDARHGREKEADEKDVARD